MGSCARPRPPTRILAQVRSDRIPLNIVRDLEKRVLPDNGMGTESILKDRSKTGGFICSTPSFRLGCAEPVHKPADRLFFIGTSEKVPMVRHDTVGKDRYGELCQSLAKHEFDLMVFLFAKKHLGLQHCAVAQVKDASFGAISEFSCHIGYNL